MHHHAYLWTGPKQRFDDEGLRRPPHSEPPPVAGSEDGERHRLHERYREVVTEFPRTNLPPIETAHWLMKPRSSVLGTWGEAQEAAVWLGEQLTEYAPRFDSAAHRDTTRLNTLVRSATERLGWGGDVSLGFYLERPAFLSLALVTCSPNRSAPGLRHPAGQGPTVFSHPQRGGAGS
ncbi:hypothetical protein [Streptomyces chattanoogensis]|uniref:hypothetical protein n=1 Tax=Streptomyces chattanoogensis TaxID=66876 RepID=UPI00099BCE71|nr:hypothetical protein [Streptomyces chattanoogensis]